MSKTLIRDGVVYYERGFVDDLKMKLKAKEEECERYEKFINRIIYQTDIKMQNYMVQTVYDRLNKECKDFMDKQKGGEGE